MKAGMQSRRIGVDTVKPAGRHARKAPHETESAIGPTVHRKLALIATVEVVLRVGGDQRHK